MSEALWPAAEEHPSGGVLLLHVEGELAGQEASAVRRHVGDCWECRAYCQQLEAGICSFVAMRRDVLIPQLPEAPASGTEFGRRLRRELQTGRGEPLGLLRRILAAPRHFALAASLVSVALAAVIFFGYVLQPPKLTAAAFFERVRAADGRPAPTSRVMARKVQYRQGERVLERNIRHSGTRLTTAEPAPDAQWSRLLTLTAVDWQNPLDATRFERWHDAQPIAADVVSEGVGVVSLTTTMAPSAPVQRASLTVRRGDWHPIAERFEFRDELPLEIRELTYEERPEEAPTPAAETVAAVVPPPVAVAPAPEVPDVKTEPEPDLDRAEIQALEALHSLGADKSEIVRMVRHGAELEVSAMVPDAARRSQLAAALEDIPGLDVRLEDPAAAVATEMRQAVTLSSFPTTPPLAKALWDSMGGMDVANRYLESVRVSYFRAWSDANALRRLAERYPEERLARLPADLRTRVDRLASDYAVGLGDTLGQYLKQASDPLDEMLRRDHDGPRETSIADSGCRAWQQFAASVPPDLEQLHKSFRRLFLIDQSDTPVTLSARDLLRAAAEARERLVAAGAAVCPPDTTDKNNE